MVSDPQGLQHDSPLKSPPGDGDIRHVIALLDEARAYTLAVLGGADPAQVVHPGSGWTVRDVAGHILAWEVEALRALQALESGAAAYAIPDFVSFEVTNARLRDQQRALSFADVQRELVAVRQQFKAVLTAFPADRFADEFDFPWPGRGTIAELVLIIAAHERGHAVEIGRAVPRE